MANSIALERTSTGPVTPAEDFDEFVRATGTRLLRTAVLLCGDPHLAEDLTQTTYAKVYVNWRRVTRADNPVAYTRTVLVRTYLSHRRRRSTSEMPIETLPERPGTADDTALRMDLLAALAQLAPADRAVLVLRYWEDLSVAQTADLLDIKETTCRARAARALARLRTHLPDLEA
ncbi:MAG TPA: SigE family RNA polymerase sigma factor [Actinophytocola sp.]|nr:SigE family RNA polymerase sigma factor [Actinophytocola sp.]